jgi:hypothetical protein
MGTMSAPLKWCLAIAAVGFLVAQALFIRMAVAVNKKLPTEKRIPLIEFRYHIMEIKRMHEDMFPESSMATVWFLLQVASASAVAIGVFLEIAR